MTSTIASPSTSASTTGIGAPSATWREPVERIVAESLVAVPDPVTATLRWPARATAEGVCARIARALVPPEGEVAAPWLRDHQRRTAAMLVSILRRHGGALLADPVGTGKTFVALAVADAVRGGVPALAVVPSPLVEQWRARAAHCGVPLEVLSHVALSRGAPLPPQFRMIIVDESHHFRHPGTERYRQLARGAAGRGILCLTATPTVNRPEDLAHQLLLGVRDDALRALGTPSLLRALRLGEIPPALGRLVVAGSPPAELPGRHDRRLDWCREEGEPPWLAQLDALSLASRNSIATLVRGVLVAAASSSPAALREALGRYAALLRHGRDAACAGRRVDRAALRRFTGDVPEQLLLWELLPDDAVAESLPLQDLERVTELRSQVTLDAPDPKAEALRALLADGTPTLVFTTSVATIPYLRERLSSLAPAWITGRGAGWKHIHLPRGEVLAWFRPGAAEVQPRILLASDVAAEGLDLQRAGRVVHYDLPWTAMRLAQREGRSRRLGAVHRNVDVVQMAVPSWAEKRLRIGAVVRRKRRLPYRIGLEGQASTWRWRNVIAEAHSAQAGEDGIVAVASTHERALVALEFTEGATRTELVLILHPDGRWAESAAAIGDAMAELPFAPEVEGADLQPWGDRLGAPIRAILRRSAERAVADVTVGQSARAVLARAIGLARVASRARDSEALATLERLVTFAGRGHTAGEASRIADWAELKDEELIRHANGLPAEEAVDDLRTIRIVAAAIFVAAGPATAPP